jgi:hypothetical protein
MRSPLRNLCFLLLVLLLADGATARGQSRDLPANSNALAEIKGKQRAKLLVIRSKVLDVSGDSSLAALEAVQTGEETERRQTHAFVVIARKLNKYLRKYKNMVAVSNHTDADYVIVFNLLRYRRILYTAFPSGELFVVAKDPAGKPRVIWRTEKEMLAEDAANKLIDAMKVVHGQR